MGELRSQIHGSWRVTLWDISKGGVCVIARDQLPEPSMLETLSLTLTDPDGRTKVLLKVKLASLKVEEGDTYLGLCYRKGGGPPSGSFLNKYLSRR